MSSEAPSLTVLWRCLQVLSKNNPQIAALDLDSKQRLQGGDLEVVLNFLFTCIDLKATKREFKHIFPSSNAEAHRKYIQTAILFINSRHLAKRVSYTILRAGGGADFRLLISQLIKHASQVEINKLNAKRPTSESCEDIKAEHAELRQELDECVNCYELTKKEADEELSTLKFNWDSIHLDVFGVGPTRGFEMNQPNFRRIAKILIDRLEKSYSDLRQTQASFDEAIKQRGLLNEPDVEKLDRTRISGMFAECRKYLSTPPSSSDNASNSPATVLENLSAFDDCFEELLEKLRARQERMILNRPGMQSRFETLCQGIPELNIRPVEVRHLPRNERPSLSSVLNVFDEYSIKDPLLNKVLGEMLKQ